uniref:urease accessory protein UreF n=1 Tax=Microbispora cellulosiformans TaxID=2614688 RepID=UPI001CDA07B8|nr:urease accessory UreF family protein [Microbispora cellulosiformans]
MDGMRGDPAALLLLADSRLPAGGHAHSGGVEEAVRLGTVTDVDDLARFLRGRLATAGLVTAALSAAACELAAGEPDLNGGPDLLGGPGAVGGPGSGGEAGEQATAVAPGPHTPHARPYAADVSWRTGVNGGPGAAAAGVAAAEDVRRRLWRRLDDEADARTASPAQREAARTQGRLLLRTARRLWPSAALDTLARAIPEGPHHPIALGAAAASAGCEPQQAALAAAYTSVTGPATAAVRLLGLDPVTVHRLLADLAPALNDAAHAACASLMDTVLTEPVLTDTALINGVPAGGTPMDTTLTGTTPAEPALSDPALSDPALGDPALGDPALGDPALGDPALGDPALGDPALGDPALSDPAGIDTPPGDAGPPPGDAPGAARAEWRGGWAGLPGHSAPALDLLAEGHLANPMKLFVS